VEIVDCAGKQRVGRRVAGDQHGLAQLCARLGERAAPRSSSRWASGDDAGVAAGCISGRSRSSGLPTSPRILEERDPDDPVSTPQMCRAHRRATRATR
jgi:hypothetical protein